MKKLRDLLKPALWPVIFPAAGLVGLLLRVWLYAAASEDGLFRRGTLPEVLLWIWTAAVLLLAAVLCFDLQKAGKYRYHFPASTLGAVGRLAAGLGIAYSAVAALVSGNGGLSVISGIVGLAAAAAMVYLAYLRFRGQRPTVLFHGIVCVYLMLRLVCSYQVWCALPQMQSYCFMLLANVLVLIACYQDAAFDAASGSRRGQIFTHLAAVYLCICCLPGASQPLFYLAMAVWMATDLCRISGSARRRTAA